MLHVRHERWVAAKELGAPYELVKDVAANGRLPVVNFVAGGISTPADAALVMQLGGPLWALFTVIALGLSAVGGLTGYVVYKARWTRA